MMTPRFRVILVSLILAACLGSLPARAADGDFKKLLPRYLESIALVLTDSGSGTAFAVESDPSGTHLVTSSHVIEGARSIRVVVGKADPVPATVVADDPKADLALLEIRGVRLVPLPLASAEPGLGADIAVVGYPLADRLQAVGMGLQPSLSKGVLSAVRQRPEGAVLQVDVPINPGNSGGPAFDWETGQVVGVAMSKLRDASDINFLVGTGSLARFLAERPTPAEIRPVAAGSLEDTLKSLGLKYEVDKDGDFKLIFDLEGGRTQLVYVNGKPWEYQGLKIREIWAPSFRSKGPLPAEQANELLLKSQNAKIGGWQVMDLGEDRVAVYAIKVPDRIEQAELREWLDLVASYADTMERQVTGQDEF